MYRYILLLIFVLFIPGILFVPETDTLHYKLSNIALMLALESSAVASTTLTITHLYFVGDWKSTLKKRRTIYRQKIIHPERMINNDHVWLVVVVVVGR